MYEQVFSQAGYVGAIIAAWILINKSNMGAFKDILTAQNKSKEEDNKLILQLVETQKIQFDRQYEALLEMITTNQHLIGQMANLKHLIETHQQCPIQRRELRSER